MMSILPRDIVQTKYIEISYPDWLLILWRVESAVTLPLLLLKLYNMPSIDAYALDPF